MRECDNYCGMTELSRGMMDIVTLDISADNVVKILEQTARFRTLKDKIRKFYPYDTVQKDIIEGLSTLHPEINRDSVRKKVNNWFNEKSVEIGKDEAIELAFILKLPLDDAETLIGMIADEKLHWRDPQDAAFGFALKKGYSYPEALALIARIEKLLGDDIGGNEDKSAFTELIKTDLLKIEDEDTLLAYLDENRSRFGRFHNFAYSLFMDWLSRLSDPEDQGIRDADVFATEQLSVSDVLKEYLMSEIVESAKDRAKKKNNGYVFDALRKQLIKKWPDTTTLSKMKNRKIDVTRKVIILLFLATADADDDPAEYDDPDFSLFDTLFRNLNDTLVQCGYLPLDPRAPFDWAVIYALYVDDLFDLDGRMTELFEAMFPAE